MKREAVFLPLFVAFNVLLCFSSALTNTTDGTGGWVWVDGTDGGPGSWEAVNGFGACYNDTDCDTYYCNMLSNTCENCLLDSDCDSGRFCSAGTCELTSSTTPNPTSVAAGTTVSSSTTATTSTSTSKATTSSSAPTTGSSTTKKSTTAGAGATTKSSTSAVVTADGSVTTSGAGASPTTTRDVNTSPPIRANVGAETGNSSSVTPPLPSWGIALISIGCILGVGLLITTLFKLGGPSSVPLVVRPERRGSRAQSAVKTPQLRRMVD